MNKSIFTTKITTFILVLLFAGVSCTAPEKLSEKGKIQKLTPPPMTERVEQNLYVDKQEICNLDYLEFLFWTAQVYGKDAETYKKLLPNENIWDASTPFLGDSVRYFSNPEFNVYPVVGISKEQAQSYTAWRTDRVSERILIERGLVKMFPRQNAENHFTVERFKNGRFEWIIKKEDVFLPVYRIPTEKEWMKIAASSYELLKRANKSKYNAKVLKNNGVLFHTAERSTSPKSKGPMPAKHLGKDLNGLFDVIGNVSEMVAEDGISKGGSWKHTLEQSAITRQMEFKAPNSWTGLRNVCSWEFVEVKQ